MSPSGNSHRKLAVNRRALRDYIVLERHEAGMELLGSEVKAVRNAHIGIAGGFARVENGQVILYNLNIPPYEYSSAFNHEPDRPRRLLLHKREINRIQIQTEQKGYALVPLSIYLKKGLIKIELGLCKGKRKRDKREILRRKTAQRETARAIARRR